MKAIAINESCPKCGHEWVCEFSVPGSAIPVRECLNPTCDHWGFTAPPGDLLAQPLALARASLNIPPAEQARLLYGPASANRRQEGA